MKDKTCKSPGCTRVDWTKGYCLPCSQKPLDTVPTPDRSGLFATNDAELARLVESKELTVELGDDGQPRIRHNGVLKALTPTSTGYLRISIGNWRKGRKRNYSVHRIVYLALIGPLDPEKVINHIDGNPLNNSPSNLELVTQAQNNLHRYRILKRPGVKSNCRIDQNTAVQIRADQQSGLSNQQLRKKYGLAKSTISYVVNSRTWKSA